MLNGDMFLCEIKVYGDVNNVIKKSTLLQKLLQKS